MATSQSFDHAQFCSCLGLCSLDYSFHGVVPPGYFFRSRGEGRDSGYVSGIHEGVAAWCSVFCDCHGGLNPYASSGRCRETWLFNGGWCSPSGRSWAGFYFWALWIFSDGLGWSGDSVRSGTHCEFSDVRLLRLQR